MHSNVLVGCCCAGNGRDCQQWSSSYLPEGMSLRRTINDSITVFLTGFSNLGSKVIKMRKT